MIEELKSLLENSYSPYSNYKVASIVKMKDGKIFSGVNVENASYGATICAERSAVVSAISNGYKKGDFESIHIMVSSGKIGMPCFLCRQVLVEFFLADDKVYCYSTEGDVEEFKLNDLAVLPFGSDDLI